MKRLLLISATLIFLTACSGETEDISQIAKKPKKPEVSQPSLQANILDAKNETDTETTEKTDKIDMGSLIDRINQDQEQQDISVQDMEKGWYYGTEDKKKWGTPDSWLFVSEGDKSHWISPLALEQENTLEADKLCRDTGGRYVISCVQSDLPHCEYIPKSECRCAGQTKWYESQGCILFQNNKFIEISKKEIQNGWYAGMNSQKKLNTPSSWIWLKDGSNSKWRNQGNI